MIGLLKGNSKMEADMDISELQIKMGIVRIQNGKMAIASKLGSEK